MPPRHFWSVAVADIAVADWYEKAFELQVIARMHPAADGSSVVVLGNADLVVELKQRGKRVARDDTADGYTKVGWFVPSLIDAQDAAVDRGAKLVTGPVDQPEFGVRFSIVADPEGNLIQLFEQLDESAEGW